MSKLKGYRELCQGGNWNTGTQWGYAEKTLYIVKMHSSRST